mgnify:FL=1
MNVFNYWKNLYNWKNPLNWWRLPGCWCRAIKYGWQRATRGFSDLDCWDLYNFYLEVLEMSLKHLAKCNAGCPNKYYDSSKSGDEDWKWRDILNKMADCFKEAHEDKTSYINPYEDEYLESLKLEKTSDGYYKLNNEEVNEELYEKYLEEEKKIFEWRNKNLKDGLDMLKEDFWNLWD